MELTVHRRRCSLTNVDALMLSPIFWPETIAIVAFRISWLTKGQAILKDQSS
jgi:hypothetical protein